MEDGAGASPACPVRLRARGRRPWGLAPGHLESRIAKKSGLKRELQTTEQISLISFQESVRHIKCPAPPPQGAKAPRAHGGCLGTGSRRRAREAAIVPGEPHSGFDPGVPEWGNPAGEGLLSSPEEGNRGN